MEPTPAIQGPLPDIASIQLELHLPSLSLTETLDFAQIRRFKSFTGLFNL